MSAKKTIIAAWIAVFCILLGNYLLNPNRMDTREVLLSKGAQTGKDYMLSSLNVTSFALDKRELMWIGTSAGINVYDGKDYVQFYHDIKDTTALPDDYINVLHLDKNGRMWVGTQNGLARYTGAYRFHRIALPKDASGNIVAIEDAPQGILASNGKQTFWIKDDDQVVETQRKLTPNNMRAPLPDDNALLLKPRDLAVATYRDLGHNLWVGFHNAGYQVISTNRTAYQYANANPLATATDGRDIISLAQVGRKILAGTTLRLYVYDTQSQQLSDTYYRTLFDSVPAPEKIAVNYIVPNNDQQAWLVGNRQVVSVSVASGKPSVIDKTRSLGLLGCGIKAEDKLYVCSNLHGVLCFSFGDSHPLSIPIRSRWFDEETQMTPLRDGNIFLFMKNMNLGILSPKTGRWQELKVSGLPDYANIDPAFVRQDSYGNIWLGTKRYGLYCLDMAKRQVHRVESLNDVHIQALIEDQHRQLWVTTMRDAFCIDPVKHTLTMNSLASSSQASEVCQFFDHSVCLAPNGDVVLGSSDGCKFIPSAAMSTDYLNTKKGQHAYRMLDIYSLETEAPNGQLKAISEHIANGSRYTFAYNENTIRLRFFYPNYSRQSALMYQYRMEGLDQDWRKPSYQHEVEFQDLAPGKYTFHLRIISSPNVPPLQERRVEIIIQPAPLESAAAWWLYIGIVLCIIYYVNSLYLKERSNRMLWLQEQREKQREKQTNEMNMSFFANISHEFRNPITIIAGPLMALNADKSLPTAVHLTLERVCMSINRMLRLIDQMLDFNQLETDALRLKVCEVDVNKEIRELASAFEESTRVKDIQLDLELSEGEMRAWLDRDKLEKILSNLFTNALKHTQPKGLIRIAAAIEDALLSVSVYNSGSHIAEDKLQDVFKRYYQLADTQGNHHYGWGSGIGLYYVKRLVGLHHGQIEVSNQDGGVEFGFTLPVDKDTYNKVEIAEHEERSMRIPLEKSTQGLPIASSTSEGKAKILIVDDDVDVASYIRSIFANDYMVVNRYSAEEALADLEEVKPDIILSDIIMGKMSGYEFCEKVKNDLAFSHIPVILITAKSDIDEQVQGLQLGAVAYVAKPFDPSYLKALVESQLQNMKTLQRQLGEHTETETLSTKASDALSEPDRKFMNELYKLMEKRSAEMELNVSTICRDLLISQSKFNYKLKELTGETPGSFFRRYKLNKAAQLLREGEHTVSEIATLTGFSTAAHFSVAFKKQFGVSPSEYPSSLS